MSRLRHADLWGEQARAKHGQDENGYKPFYCFVLGFFQKKQNFFAKTHNLNMRT
jgi:hypothetical protein